MAIKMGSKVRIRVNETVAYVHRNDRSKPYPFYVHIDKDVPEGTILNGPYSKDDLEEVED